MKQFLPFLLLCVVACQNKTEVPQQNTSTSKVVEYGQITPVVETPGAFDNLELLGQWKVENVVSASAEKAQYQNATIHLAAKQRLRITQGDQLLKQGFWNANRSSTKMKWIIKEEGMLTIGVVKEDELLHLSFSNKQNEAIELWAQKTE